MYSTSHSAPRYANHHFGDCSGGGRSNNLKSHGTFKAKQANGQSICLSATDLYDLAARMDQLESDYRAALANHSQPSGAQISYNYHRHTGSSSAGTGCYRSPVYHVHTNSCYRETHCDCSGYEQGRDLGDTGYGGPHMYECRICGHNSYIHHGDHSQCDESVTVTVCGKSTTGTIDHYDLGCGKTANVTIESATIVYP